MPRAFTRFPSSLSLRLLFLGLLAALLLAPERVLAQAAQAFTPPVAVGAASAAQPVSLTIQHPGTLGSIRVRTGGNDGYDFAAAATGSTCQTGLQYVAAQTCTVQVIFTPTAPGQRLGAVVLLDSSGNVMGSTLLSASATGGLHVFVPGTINTVAGTSVWIYDGDGSSATGSAIFLPFGVAVDASGALFIADNGNNRIRRVDPVTGNISTIAGQGIIGYGGDGSPATSALLSAPTGIVVDPIGNVFFADSGNNIVRRIDAFTGLISTVAGVPGHHGFAGDAGAASSALLNTPNGLAFDASGDLLIADTGNHAIRRVDALTGIITTVAGTGTPGYTGDGGLALAALLNSPWGVTVSAAGEILIADQGNHAIRKISTAGIIQTIAGNGSQGFSNDGSAATTAQLNSPADVAVDVAGNIYIADSGNNRIRKINASTGIINTVAGSDSQAFGGDQGPANVAGIYGPYSLALDSTGSLLIADVFHNRIRRIASNNATLKFQPIRVGRVSSPLIQTVENDGNATLTPGTIVQQSNSAADPADTTCSPSSPLAPLAQCMVGAAFAPTVTGNPVLGATLVNSDAANSPGTLVLTGQVLDIDPATVTLTSSANPSQTGSSVTFTVNVSSAGVTPTGNISLLDGTSILAVSTLDQYGNATFTLSTLTSGQHSLTASYAGDKSNTAAVSAVLLEVVKDQVAATTTVLSTAANPVVAGSAAKLTVQVSPKVTGSGSGAINGTVTLTDGTFIFGTYPVSNGYSSFTESLATGSHNLVATYNGSTTYGTSASAGVAITATIAPSKSALATSANPSAAGAALTLTATITSVGGGTPSGQVSFTDGSTVLGSATLNADGIGALVVPGTNWTPGTHTLSVSYAGDTNDQPSNTTGFAQVVNQATTTTLLSASANPVSYGGSLTLTAAVSGNGGIPTGSVQFFDGGVSLGSVPVNAAGSATLNTSSLTVGAHTLTAVYSGDTDDAASTSTALALTVQSTTVSVGLSASSNPFLLGTQLTLAAGVTGSGAQPTGSVQFLDGSTVLGTSTTDSNGNATLAVTTLTLGSHSLSAVYAGDKSHGSATSVPVTLAVDQPTVTTFTAASQHSIAGTALPLTLTVTGKTSQVPTGQVTLNDNGSSVTTLPLDAHGAASYSSSLTPGQHSLIATYGGDSVDAGSNSTAVIISVDAATSSTTVTASANPANSGTSVAFTATVASNGAAPTGKVTFLDGTAVLATAALQANGTATFQTSTLTPGLHAITASYSGDTDTAASTSPVLTERIAQVTAVTLASSSNPSLLTDPVTITVTVSNGTGNVPTGSVTLTDGSNPIATATLGPNGTVAFPLSSPALGQHTLLASYAGDPQNLPATSQPLVQVVNLRPTTVTFTSSNTALSAGDPSTFVAVVQGQGSRNPTGTVTFASGSTTIGSGTISATGVLTATFTLAQGSYSVIATYSGDLLFAASSSAPVTIVVGPTTEFLLSTNPPSISLKSGSHTTIQLSLTSAPTFSDTLALGCAGLPADATCTFSDNQIKVSGGIAHNLTVMVDTGNPLGSGATASVQPGRVGNAGYLCALPFGALLMLVLGRKRFRFGSYSGLLCSLLLLLGAASVLTGCGNSFTQQSTPAGSYSFQIVASGNVSGKTQTTTVQLTVTP